MPRATGVVIPASCRPARLTQSPSTSSSYAVNQFGTFTVSNPNAPNGDTATFQITNPLQGALTTSQAIYQLGQPVQLTYAETNTSDQAVRVSIIDPILFELFHNGQQVSPAMDPAGVYFGVIDRGKQAATPAFDA